MSWFILGTVLVGGAVGAAGTLVVAGGALRVGFYRRLYAPEFPVDLAAGLSRAKRAALAGSPPDPSPADLMASGHAFTLASGLAVAYTIRPDEGRFRHHLSMSYKGGWFATSAAGYVAALICRMLAPPVPVAFFLLPSGVYHLAFELPADRQERWAALAVQAVEPADGPRWVDAGRGEALAFAGRLERVEAS